MTIELATILAAVITANALILAAVITNRFSIGKQFVSMAPGQRSLTGHWRGKTQQHEGPSGQPIKVDLVLDLTTKGKTVTGTARVQGGGGELVVKINGGFIKENYLYLRYESNDTGKVNFGFCLLRYNGEGTVLEGKMIGYGHLSEKLVSGEMRLQRI